MKNTCKIFKSKEGALTFSHGNRLFFGWWLKADKMPAESWRLKSRLSVSAIEMCLFVSNNNQRALFAKWNYLTDFAIISTVEVVWSNYITLRTILRSWMDCTNKMSERDKCLLNMNLRHYNQGGNKFNRPQKTVRILTVQQYSALTIWGKFSFKAILSNWELCYNNWTEL